MNARVMRCGNAAGFAASLLTCGLLVSSSHAQLPPPAGTTAGWYDASPLLVSLRPAERASAAQAAGVGRADELPLYELSIDLDLAAGVFAVREQLWFTNRESAPLDELVLRIFANAGASAPTHVRRAPVRFDGGRCLDGVVCTVTSPDPGVIVVRPAVPIVPGGRIRVDVDLGGTLERIDASRTNLMAQGLEGLTSMQSGESAGDYGLVAMGDGIASLANFYAVLARREGGRWMRSDDSTLGDLGTDELAHFRAHVRVGDGVQLVSTGVTLSAAGGRRARVPPRTEIVAAFVRDFALLASRDFEVATRDVGGVTVRSWFRPSERAAGRHVLDVAASALAIFVQRFGAYPYVDLDLVEAAIIGGAGGVEFAGLVTVASMFYKAPPAGGGALGLLGGASTMDATTARMREFVTAHEVAHQYWHGLVGSDSRAHPFVDEGLAQWSAMLYLEERYGRDRARRDGDMQVRMNYQMMRMQNVSDAPVDRPVRDFASPLAYAGLVYGKGPYVYEALRREVGDTTFFAALHEYVRTYRFRAAPQRGFVDLLARGPQAARVRALARRWLDERHGDEDVGRGDVRTLAATMMGIDADELPPELDSILGALAGRVLGGGSTTAGAGAQAPDVGMQGVEQLIQVLQGAGP